MSDQDVFVEQAEYINNEAFVKWNIEHPEELTILKKLSQTGAKLITGPRGSGKTTLMLKTYKKCISRESSSLPIYVNFKSSLKIEPLYRKNSNAVYWFNQWLLFKIYQGIFNTLSDINIPLSNTLIFKKEDVDRRINYIELGKTDTLFQEEGLTVSILEDEINQLINCFGKNHCVLLLDDAAHAFSSEQQKDFFDFFRQIKSRYISPKAAIYPGVTTYSSTFHIGHDAEEIDIWIKPESDGYLSFMKLLLKKRLSEKNYNFLASKPDLLEILCYSAFGIPRALLNMIQTLYKEDFGEENNGDFINYNRASVFKSVNLSLRQTKNIYLSLKTKLPIYENFILKGDLIFSKMVSEIKDYNKEKTDTDQAVIIGIQKPLPIELIKVFNFFQYAGLLMPKSELSKGEKGVFELYAVHYAALVENNAFLGKKSITTTSLATALRKRNAHSYKRITPKVLLGTEDYANYFPLSLPPCQVCNSPRMTENAKFCLSCGAQLVTASIYEALIQNDISVLPLTSKRISSIKKYSSIRTIKDILLDNGNIELRKVPQIGPHWAKEIYSYAEEYLG